MLANGKNPLNGKAYPEDSPINDLKVARVLFSSILEEKERSPSLSSILPDREPQKENEQNTNDCDFGTLLFHIKRNNVRALKDVLKEYNVLVYGEIGCGEHMHHLCICLFGEGMTQEIHNFLLEKGVSFNTECEKCEHDPELRKKTLSTVYGFLTK